MMPLWFWIVALGTPWLGLALVFAGIFGWHLGGYIGAAVLVSWGLAAWWFATHTRFN